MTVPKSAARQWRAATPILDRNSAKRPLLDVQIWIEPPFGSLAGTAPGVGGVIFAEDVRTIGDLDERLEATFAELRAKFEGEFAKLIERRQAEEAR